MTPPLSLPPSTSLPRRLLLKLAGTGLAAAPLPALAASEGTASAPPPKPAAEVWTEFFKGQRIWAYVDRHSIRPGEGFNVMAAGGPGQPSRRARLEVFRVGATDPTPVWQSEFVDVAYRGPTASGAAIGPGWPPTWAVSGTAGWRPGCYYADIVEQTTATRDVKAVFFVVTNPARSGRVLLKLGTNTYQAYNAWGGHSIYPNDDDEARGLIVSFDRPLGPAFFEYDVFLVQWLEGLANSLGGVDYATNFDVHQDAGIIARYPLVLCSAHDEYWTKEEFDAFERRIFRGGKNVAFLGADTAYCQIRFGDLNAPPGAASMGRQLVCYKTSFDPVQARIADASLLTTNNFRTGGRRPETGLLGGAFQNWFEAASPDKVPLKVARADLPFFEGVGWKVGDVAANVVGYEWDNRDPNGDGKRLFTGAAQPPVPASAVQVLFSGEARGADGRPGVAESTLYTAPSGAKVFNAGVVRWAWGLGKAGFADAKFQKFNENLVRALSR